jgi:hypothetical protein
MKLLIGNGAELTAYDLGPMRLRVRMRPGGAPIKFHGCRLLSDDDAREALKEFVGATDGAGARVYVTERFEP